MHIKIDVSPAELIDKLSILEIKLDKIEDEAKLKNINYEYTILFDILEKEIKMTDRIQTLSVKLKDANLKIWEIEDDIRECERQKLFDDKFITLARGVYFNNDERCRIKKEINEICGSKIIEEKSHEPY